MKVRNNMKFYEPDLFDEVPYKVEPNNQVNNGDENTKRLSALYAKEALLEAQYKKIERTLKGCRAEIELVKNKVNKENKQCKYVETDLFS